MNKRVIQSDSPNKLGEVLSKLQQAQRELERIQFNSHDNADLAIPGDELLGVAKSLSFIWNSRKNFVDESLVSDTGWLILLNLKIAELSHEKIMVTTICQDSGSPATTALRWIKLLESRSLVVSEPDLHDRRRKYVKLTDSGSELMSRYLQNIQHFITTRGIIF